MDASQPTLATLLTLAGLIAATSEYSHLIRRRIQPRPRSVVDPATLEESGLRGLVRVLAVND